MEQKNTLKTLRVSMIPKELLQSHMGKMKEKFASNRVVILQELGLSEVEYERQFLEAGCRFLEVLYGEGSVWYERLSKNSECHFWKWFKAEFKILENEFIQVLKGGEIEFTINDWNEFTENVIPHDQFLEKFNL